MMRKDSRCKYSVGSMPKRWFKDECKSNKDLEGEITSLGLLVSSKQFYCAASSSSPPLTSCVDKSLPTSTKPVTVASVLKVEEGVAESPLLGEFPLESLSLKPDETTEHEDKEKYAIAQLKAIAKRSASFVVSNPEALEMAIAWGDKLTGTKPP
ncbi:hypothetical protein BGZ76_006690 [Entomortierella beljakovae]|nr:hypothetical protein BGZ76_006690 [Entomortierella beljakovae]